MVMGLDVKIKPLLEEWRMDLSERGIEIKKKPGQIVHTCDRWMAMGVPTALPNSVVHGQLTKTIVKVEGRIRKDDSGWYDQSLHATSEPIKFALVKKFL